MRLFFSVWSQVTKSQWTLMLMLIAVVQCLPIVQQAEMVYLPSFGRVLHQGVWQPKGQMTCISMYTFRYRGFEVHDSSGFFYCSLLSLLMRFLPAQSIVCLHVFLCWQLFKSYSQLLQGICFQIVRSRFAHSMLRWSIVSYLLVVAVRLISILMESDIIVER